ncbi:MAG TPA: hypothetical protein VHV78_17095 [Gemmatimonadaceae bacterium]|jgi:hypothetical protein|nr:hypothetical protein [Gemmatimonadaceae bacterium]
MSALRSVTTALAVVFFATPMMAQRVATTQDTVVVTPSAPSASVSAPATIDLAPARLTPSWVDAVLVAPSRAQRASTLRVSDSSSNPQSAAMMIVGGAGLLVGGIIGGRSGAFIMVGGALVGLLGLWDYLK